MFNVYESEQNAWISYKYTEENVINKNYLMALWSVIIDHQDEKRFAKKKKSDTSQIYKINQQ